MIVQVDRFDAERSRNQWVSGSDITDRIVTRLYSAPFKGKLYRLKLCGNWSIVS
jgi:hypothetical protein